VLSAVVAGTLLKNNCVRTTGDPSTFCSSTVMTPPPSGIRCATD